MSLRYKGGVISATPPTTTGGESGTASGNWTLEQQMQAQGAGNWPVPPVPKYIEDVFQTWLYSGNSSTQTITNGIDLSTYGGLVWFKCRTLASNNRLTDTVRGAGNSLISNSTLANQTSTGSGEVSSFTSTGYTTNLSGFNSTDTYVSWTFRKQPKFFDVVTFYQNGGVTVNHNLGSVPACIIIKSTSAADNWYVYHTSLNAPNGNGPRYNYLTLNSTANALNAGGIWINNITSTSFDITNQVVPPFATYVAYIFASNAGGFGLTGTDNVISCGSFTCDGSGNLGTVTLGYEPQWVLVKRTDAAQNWNIFDTMRGMSLTNQQTLNPNLSNVEGPWPSSSYLYPTATGFAGSGNFFGLNAQCVYIAIRRGPMQTPTSGTSVYESTTSPASGSPGFTAGFPVDFAWLKRPAFTGSNFWGSRLTGAAYLDTTDTAAEQASGNWTWDYQSGWFATGLGSTYRSWMIRRAPGFFDVVCYTGNSPSPAGYSQTLTHNLGVPPELTIVKWRSGATGESWAVMCTSASSSPDRRLLFLDSTAAGGGLNSYFSDASGTPVLPTATQFTVGSNAATNKSAATYVAYLFASVAGVSKVGSYSGTGALQTVNCGFTSGARWVMIKRTDSTGDWWVYDSARGITSGNDPYLFLNSTAAEVTGTNYVDTDTTGFKVTAAAPAGLNANGGTYIFLAIA